MQALITNLESRMIEYSDAVTHRDHIAYYLRCRGLAMRSIAHRLTPAQQRIRNRKLAKLHGQGSNALCLALIDAAITNY